FYLLLGINQVLNSGTLIPRDRRLTCRLLWVARDNLRISPETTLTSYVVPPFGRKDR
ncbi:hypothetical protein HN51_022465, partial [Arachis hypogaea]